MSQQTQAEGIHQEGKQRFEEARAKLESLHTKHKKGELSGEALAAEEKAIDQALADADKFLDRARKLNTVNRGTAELDELSREPAYRRPMGEGGTPADPNAATATDPNALTAEQRAQQLGASFMSGQQRLELALVGMGMNEPQLLNAARIAGVAPHEFRLLTGRDRQLLNRFIRGKHIRESDALTAKEREQLNVSPYIDRDGGWVTSTEMRNEIIGHLRDRRHIRSRARVIPTNAATVAFPTFKVRISLKKTRAHKGKVDGSGPVEIRDILGKTEFTPSGRMEIIKVPEELIEDSAFDVIGFLSEEIALEAFDDEEKLFLTSDGVNSPYGVLKAPIPGVNHTGASGAAFKPEDIKTLPFEIREVYRSAGVWMANRSFYRKVTVMRSEDGGAGTGQFLFQPGLRAGDPPTLVGYETLESEFFPDHIDGAGGATQAAGDPLCLFGDWRQYWIVDRLSLEIKVLDEKYADEMQIGFRYRKRLDGAPVRLESWVTLDRKA